MDRQQLLAIFQAGLRAVDGRSRTRDYLQRDRPPGPIHLIGIGKCAAAMALGAMDALGRDLCDGLVITRQGYAPQEIGELPRIAVMESAHPVPDSTSIEAGQRLLDYIGGLPPGCRVLVLISGGASSLAEVLPAGVGAAELQRVNRWLLGSGLDIFGINSVRRRMSRIKDGGLLSALWGRSVLALYVSDVAGDDPAWIGSGLLASMDAPVPHAVPQWIRDLLQERTLTGTPDAAVTHVVIASLEQALDACGARAGDMGLEFLRHRNRLDGSVEAAAGEIVEAVRGKPEILHIWGGEPTLKLPAEPGRGGRCQHLALHCATRIQGARDVAVLCAATDGADGPGEDAGALVDGETVARGRDSGLDPESCLSRADSAAFLEAAGDLIYTGPTSTNVNDIIIGASGYTR